MTITMPIKTKLEKFIYVPTTIFWVLMLHITIKSLGNFWLKFTSMVTFLPQNPMVGYKVFSKLQGMQPTKTLFLVKKEFCLTLATHNVALDEGSFKVFPKPFHCYFTPIG
jgi:hypothetical protein